VNVHKFSVISELSQNSLSIFFLIQETLQPHVLSGCHASDKVGNIRPNSLGSNMLVLITGRESEK